MQLAALMPDNADVSIIDERVQDIDFKIDVDLVGITCMTHDSSRAYEMAEILIGVLIRK